MRLTCQFCTGVVFGDAYVAKYGVLHRDCVAPWTRKTRGLIHGCPVCGKTGKVPDPKNTRQVDKLEPIIGTPPCAYDGCRGCQECFSMTRRVTVTVVPDKRCELCNGEGYLTYKPEPITETKVIGWKRPPAECTCGQDDWDPTCPLRCGS